MADISFAGAADLDRIPLGGETLTLIVHGVLASEKTTYADSGEVRVTRTFKVEMATEAPADLDLYSTVRAADDRRKGRAPLLEVIE